MSALTFRLTPWHVLLLVTALLTGCATYERKGKFPESLSETALYQIAQQALTKKSYTKAIQAFRTLESRYPFGTFAEQAQLDVIYAYFMNEELEAVSAAADRFIRLHPQHKNVDYAFYMKGLAASAAATSLMARYLPVDMTRRDTSQAQQSFREFQALLNRYPNSQYAPDARQRMIALRNQLAAYETHVARYYLKRKAYVAAINRGRYVVETMQQTPAVAEALAIMVAGYRHLGLTEPANAALSVLTLNHPNHPAIDQLEAL